MQHHLVIYWATFETQILFWKIAWWSKLKVTLIFDRLASAAHWVYHQSTPTPTHNLQSNQLKKLHLIVIKMMMMTCKEWSSVNVSHTQRLRQNAELRPSHFAMLSNGRCSVSTDHLTCNVELNNGRCSLLTKHRPSYFALCRWDFTLLYHDTILLHIRYTKWLHSTLCSMPSHGTTLAGENFHC